MSQNVGRDSTESDGTERFSGFLTGFPSHPHVILLFFTLLLLVARNASNCPEECLFSGIRAQARQRVSFSKGTDDWQGHDLLYLQVLCDSPEGLRPRQAPLALLHSLIQSVFIILH